MMNEEPPPRGSLFFWVSKRKVRFNRQKIFLRLMSTTRPSIEERFCVPTLEKKGTKIFHGLRGCGIFFLRVVK